MYSRLITAADFAATKHQTQRRKDAAGTPYINHPIGVAKLLSDAGVDEEDVLIAALLHDTIEDTNTKPEEIRELFGEAVLSIVLEVTDNKSDGKVQRKRDQIEHAAKASRQAKLVKLADKLYNLSSLLTSPPPSWSSARTQGYFVWAKKVIEGMHGTNASLESQLEHVFAQNFHDASGSHPAIPAGDLDAHLEAYYEGLEGEQD